MPFKRGDVLEDWRSAVIVPLYKGKGERNEYSNFEVLACKVWLEKYMQGS